MWQLLLTVNSLNGASCVYFLVHSSANEISCVYTAEWQLFEVFKVKSQRAIENAIMGVPAQISKSNIGFLKMPHSFPTTDYYPRFTLAAFLRKPKLLNGMFRLKINSMQRRDSERKNGFALKIGDCHIPLRKSAGEVHFASTVTSWRPLRRGARRGSSSAQKWMMKVPGLWCLSVCWRANLREP